MSDPHGCINDHPALRRRGMPEIFGCLPPSAASRLGASRAIRASRFALTRAAFPWIPVASRACIAADAGGWIKWPSFSLDPQTAVSRTVVEESTALRGKLTVFSGRIE